MTPLRLNIISISGVSLLLLTGTSYARSQSLVERVTHRALTTFHIRAIKGAPADEKLMAASQDGKRYIRVEKKVVKIGDCQDHKYVGATKPIKEISTDGLKALALNKDGTYIAAGYADHTIHVWKVAGGNKLQVTEAKYNQANSAITALAFIPAQNKEALVICESNKDMSKWEFLTAVQFSKMATTDTQLKSLVYVPMKETLVGLDDKGQYLQFYDLQGNKKAASVKTDEYTGQTKKGKVAGLLNVAKETIDFFTDTEDTDEPTHSHPIDLVKILVDSGKEIVLPHGNSDNTGKVASKSDHVELKAPKDQQPQRSINALVFKPVESPNPQLVSAGADKKVRSWDLEHKKLEKSTVATTENSVMWAHRDSASSIAFSSDARYVASGGWDNDVVFSDVDAHGQIRLSKDAYAAGHSDAVLCVAFRPQNAGGDDHAYLLASGGNDKKLVLWKMTPDQPNKPICKSLTGDKVHAPQKGIAAVAFSPDGNLLAAGSLDGSVYFWTLKAAQEEPIGFKLRFIGAMPTGGQSVINLIFLPGAPGKNGQPGNIIMATAGIGTSVRLWDLGSAKLWDLDSDSMPPTLPNLDASRNLFGVKNVYSLAYNTKRHLLAAGTSDTSLCLWKVPEKDFMNTPPNPTKPINPSEHKPSVAVDKNTGAKKLGIVRSLAFDQSGRWMASGGGGDNSSVLLWDLDILDLSVETPTKQAKKP